MKPWGTRTIDVKTSGRARQPGTHEIGFDSATDTIATAAWRHIHAKGFAQEQQSGTMDRGGSKACFEFSDVLLQR